MLPEIKKVITS